MITLGSAKVVSFTTSSSSLSGTATPASMFAASIGVNTHLDETWTAYANVSTVINALRYLEVSTVRDSMEAPTDPALFRSVAAAAGVKFDVYLSQSSFGFDGQIAAMHSDADILRAVEGINEGDTATNLTYAGQTGYDAIALAQAALYAAFAPSGMTVIAPSYGITTDYMVANNTAASSTAGNVHQYAGTGNPPGSGIATFLNLASAISGTEPVIATEAGYYTGSSLSGSIAAYQHSGVSEVVQAKYLLTLAFDNWKAGIHSTDFYELLDRVSDPTDTNSEDHYGLFYADGSPKITATALHNLMATLADSGSARADQFGYAVVGAAPNADSLLLEKSDGTFTLAVWNDIRLADSSTGVDLANPTTSVTVQFGRTVQSVREIDPLIGTDATAVWSNVSSITINLPDHPVLFEINTFPVAQFSLSSFVIPETVASGASIDLWSSMLADAKGGTGALTVSAIGAPATRGGVTFDPASQILRYTASTYSPLSPNDSLTFTLADAAGNVTTGTIVITETPPPNTLYNTVSDTRLNAPVSGWTLVSLAAGQQLYSDYGNTTLVGGADTTMYDGQSGNIFTGSAGNHTIGAGAGAHITLGDGDNTIGLTGSGNVVTVGNGNNLFWKSTGSTTITAGNGNQNITMGGASNSVTLGVGSSTINIGVDGSVAGSEIVSIAGGNNSISVGGSGDSVTVNSGANRIVTQGDTANITICGGDNSVVMQGANSVITVRDGRNTIGTSGDGDTIQLGSGDDTLWDGGNNNHILSGSGSSAITFVGSGDTVDLTQGAATVTAQGSGATFVLAGSSGAASIINGNILTAGDTIDLRPAMLACEWDGRQADLSNFLKVQVKGNSTIIQIDRDGDGPSGAVTIATLIGTSTNYAGLIAHTLLPLQPTIKVITGNPDGGVTLSGESIANTNVTVLDSARGNSAVLGVANTSSSGSWTLTTHIPINTSSINSFTAIAQDGSGHMGSTTGQFLLASAGIDALTGSSGVADVFAIMSFKGSDIINGFETSGAVGSAHDIINLSGRGFATFSQLKPMISGTSSAVISIGQGKTVTLTGIPADSISAADFRFS